MGRLRVWGMGLLRFWAHSCFVKDQRLGGLSCGFYMVRKWHAVTYFY